MQLQIPIFLKNQYVKLSPQFLDTQVPMSAYARVFMHMCMQRNTKIIPIQPLNKINNNANTIIRLA